MIKDGQTNQNVQTKRVFLNEAEKSVDVSPLHASSEASTVDQGFSSDNASTGADNPDK